MRHSIVIIDGIRYWKTEIGGEVVAEFEPVEVQVRELTVRQFRNGEWQVEVLSYASNGRTNDNIRFTEIPFVKRDVAFAAARRFLGKKATLARG